MPNSKGAKGQGAMCILEDVIIMMLKDINNTVPLGKLTLKNRKREKVKKKKAVVEQLTVPLVSGR